MQKPTAQPALQLRMAEEVRVVGWQIAGLDPGKEGALWSFCVFLFPLPLLQHNIYFSEMPNSAPCDINSRFAIDVSGPKTSLEAASIIFYK